MAPVYDKDGSSVYRRNDWYVEDSGLAYPVQRAYVKVGGSLYQYFGGGTPYALMKTGTFQTTLYSIDETTGVLTQVGNEQTNSGIDQISGIGAFTVGSTAYAVIETASSGSAQTTLYSIDETTGVLTQVGNEQTISGADDIEGIGTFTVGSTAYALVETGITGAEGTTLYSIDETTGVLTQVGNEQSLNVGEIRGLGTFTVGSTAYALVETGQNQTTLYSIDETTGVLTQVGNEQTISGIGLLSGIGTFTVGSTAYALAETGVTGAEGTTLYSIDETTGVLTQVGNEQTISGIGGINGIGTFVV